ncbi:Serine/Threonine kinase family protein [Quillaja saponaria]|uniref:Serine/Threonine kinase family protein n=1 Tax=Quillaja saponaria TaxID=32244 RepID=A0AAD7LZL7_QUISA|nr:Serine/Threonine kinase family protein [Quillaja saponaria]
MNVGGNHQPPQKTASTPLSRQSPLALNSPATKARSQEKARPFGCCGGFNDCVTMQSTVSNAARLPHQPQHLRILEQQVADLEKEVQKQKELRTMYRKRLERTQDYLRYCLQVAQENGILRHIIYNKGDAQQSVLSSHTPNNNPSPQILTPQHQHSHLASLIEQAKINGWYIDPPEIELEEKIGQGSTADIYRGTWRGLDVAVKCISPDFFSSNANGVTFFSQELETLCKQRHGNVLQLMGACIDPPHHAWVVTELLSMTLKDWLHGPGNRRRERVVPLPPFKDRVTRSLEIAQAMQYLHQQKPKLIHRDLKPSNIFMDNANHVRVADFGHARFLDEEEMALTGETGTYVYMAPEVIQCEPYNEKCDVYSFGIILNELLTGKYPYIDTDYGPTKIAMEVVEGKLRPVLPEKNDAQLEDLIKLTFLCWDGDPSIRPSFAIITCSLKKILNRIL